MKFEPFYDGDNWAGLYMALLSACPDISQIDYNMSEDVNCNILLKANTVHMDYESDNWVKRVIQDKEGNFWMFSYYANSYDDFEPWYTVNVKKVTPEERMVTVYV